MVKYLSGRQKLRPSDKLTEDRYQYLGLDQAEPNLADPATSPGVPSGLQYQLVAVTGYEGRRYWVPVGGSLQPGAITIFDEGTPVSSASSITQMNFVGAAVTAQVSLQNPSGHPGIAATVTVIPVTVGDSPPIGVGATNNGELWWESDTGDLFVYYNDGSSSQWVMANAGGRGITGDKGASGDKGQKGEVGLTGAQGAKGQKGEVGIGQKGEVGDKGQKGEIGVGSKGDKGAPGNDGTDGDKGQKGELGTKGDKGDGSAGGASVTISDNAPSSPNNGDLWWESDTFDLHVYYQDGSSNQWVSITSNAALKGEKGDKGQKGEVGAKGQKGEIGEKGQKGEIGATGGTGGTGSKGQKGEVGQTGAAADKGQKGEVGATGSGGSTGSQGQKGEPGSGGSDGANGSDGDKGQKGEVGTDANLPVGTIVAYGGNSAPTGWQICNGATASTSALQTVLGISNVPDLRDRFIIGAGNSYSRHDTGGSKDAVVVLHNHGVTDPTHGHSVNDPGHFHTTNNYVARSNYAEPRNFGVGTDGNLNSTGDTNSKTTGLVVNAGGTGISVNLQGESGTDKNLPPYYALIYIIKT